MGMLMFLYGFQGIYSGGTNLPIGAYILKAEKKKKNTELSLGFSIKRKKR